MTTPDAPKYPLTLPEMPLHDPYVLADEATGQYFLYTSNVAAMSGEDVVGTMVYRSRDLRRWSRPSVVFRAAEPMAARQGAWAPEVHAHRGRYILLVTLHDEEATLPVPAADGYGLPVPVRNHVRGTFVAVAESPSGPFLPLAEGSLTPPDFMALDGTLFVDPEGDPWLVYAHEWLQKIDGTIEAIPLREDLAAAAGEPIHLFRGSEAAWLTADLPRPSAHQLAPYVTDGPQLLRAPSGALIMLWSTYAKDRATATGMVEGDYVQTWAVAESGELAGPWVQQEPLLRQDSGHGMVFRALDGDRRPLLIVHRPFRDARGKLYELEIEGSGLRIGRQLTELDGGG